jgi:polyhydroxyalkanoate synthesis regulator phasin
VTTVVAAFVIVAAVAIVIQMGIMLALYLGMKQTASRMEGVVTRLEQQASPLLATATEILDDAKPKIAEITSNMAESSATVRAHVSQVAEASAEIVERARLNAERVDEFVGNTMHKIEMASGLLEAKVLSPVRRVQAIIQAVTTGLSFFRSTRSRSAGRPGASRSREDEEMFI